MSSVDNLGRILGDMDLIVEFRRRGTSTRSQPSNSGEAHSYSRRYGDLQSDGTWGRGGGEEEEDLCLGVKVQD